MWLQWLVLSYMALVQCLLGSYFSQATEANKKGLGKFRKQLLKFETHVHVLFLEIYSLHTIEERRKMVDRSGSNDPLVVLKDVEAKIIKVHDAEKAKMVRVVEEV